MKDENTKITPELVPAEPNTTLNENDTVYDLLPTIINKPPVVVQSITEASMPQIKASSAAVNSNKSYMYTFPDGNTKVHINTSITLKVVAEQPDVYNVENGELVLKQAQEDLVYAWTFNGQRITANDEEPSLRASRVLNGNTITITNMVPKYAGVYNCTVSNDIGSTDGGTVSLEVFNSDIDDLFYTNLVQNPNGTAEDGSLSTQGWQTVSGNIQAKQLKLDTDASKHKRIEVDPFNPDFEWTADMLYPKPYQIDGGSLGNNALESLNSYFTRTDYNYILNGGNTLFNAYQDIDLTDLRSHIQGAIYGIEGVRAVFSFYLGMAIYNYTPAYPYISPEVRADERIYFKGAPRLSFENFIKVGPGFVRELAYVELIEYDGEERLQSTILNQQPSPKPIRVVDPWNKRLPQYNNQVYYPGGAFKASPDQPSKGDRRDKHLFVADELVPNPADRFTYGQYAELNKIVLDKLHPRTSKIRINLFIEPKGGLTYRLREEFKTVISEITDGVLEAVSWEKTYKTLSVESDNSTETDRAWIGSLLRDFRKEEPLNLRIPKASDSKAFMSGFNLALVPLEIGKQNEVDREVDLLISKNTRVPGAIPATISQNATFDARDKGRRDLDISFEMSSSATLNISIISTNPDIPQSDTTVLSYSSGLFPFTGRESVQIAATAPADSSNATPQVASPTYMQPGFSNNVIKTGVDEVPAYTVSLDGKTGNITYTDNTSLKSAPPDASLYLQVKETSSAALYRYNTTQLVDQAGFNDINSVEVSLNGSTPIKAVPQFPANWYNISDDDKLKIYNSEDVLAEYDKWSTPQNILDLSGWYEEWTNLGAVKKGLEDYRWSESSRFIITLGVHNTNEPVNSPESLHSTETYYLDFVQDNAIIHKTPNVGGIVRLPGFSKEERYFNDPYKFQNKATGEFESFVSDVYQTFTTKFLEEQIMTPVIIPTTVPNDVINNTVSLNLPSTLLTGSRSSGGLNIPTIQQDNEGPIADPNYKVILYGIRPATSGEYLSNNNTLDNNLTVGTPIAGSDSDGNVYTVKNITVTNNVV